MSEYFWYLAIIVEVLIIVGLLSELFPAKDPLVLP